jgi:hypothetical protein
VKKFARVSCFAARTGKSVSAGNNPDRAAAASYRAAGIPTDDTYPVPGKLGTGVSRAELEQLAETWGTEFADCLIADRRWPSCNQAAAVVAAGAIVKFAIARIARILDVGDFAPHTEMMSATMHNAFWNSMPMKRVK